ncbi:hypothetical protein HYW67_04465 [Candidatus Parcubacteria bacterium]|nr:hypothetical protein [Candidatus Parcubacteria bacterium]
MRDTAWLLLTNARKFHKNSAAVEFRQQETTKEDDAMVKAHWMEGSTRTAVLYYKEEGLITLTEYERAPVSYAARIEQGATGVLAVVNIWLACTPDKPNIGVGMPTDLGGWLLQMGTEKVDRWDRPADEQPYGLSSWPHGRPWTTISFSIAAEGLGSLDSLREKLRRALEIIHERLEAENSFVAALLET